MLPILCHTLIILMFPTPTTVVIDDEGECVFWYDDDAPEKKKPCGKYGELVPDNANPIGVDDYEIRFSKI